MNIFKKISKIIAYIPLLWKDEDWDYEYLVDLVYFKLKRMRKCFQEEDILAPDIVDDMLNSIDCTIHHIDNFQDPTCEKFEAIYGKAPINITTPTEYNEISEEEKEKFNEYIQQHHSFEQSEWNGIWDTIRSEGRGWWS